MSGLSEAELTDWLRDVALMRGGDRTATVATVRDRATRELAFFRGRGFAPLEAQLSALSTLNDLAPDALDVTWNATGGTPRRIVGPMFVRRGLDARAVAERFISERWPTLQALFQAGADDRLEPVRNSRDEEFQLASVLFQRYVGSLPVVQDTVEVFVSDDDNSLGAGVVMRVGAEWSRNVGAVPAPATLIARARALELAESALGTDLSRPGAADAELAIHCLGPTGDRTCAPTWRVRDFTGAAPARSATPSPRHDSVAYIDAVSGAIRLLHSEAADISGHVSINTNYPYDTADVQRDYQIGSIVATSGGLTTISSTNAGGDYSISTAATSGFIDPHSPASHPGTRVEVVAANDCTSGLRALAQPLPLGITHPITIVPNSTNCARTVHTAASWTHYLTNALGVSHGGYVERPSLIRLSSDPGAFGGQAGLCGGNTTRLGFGCGTDAVSESATARFVMAHEFFHTVDLCTNVIGPGCGYTDPTDSTTGSAFIEGAANAFGAWFGRYQDGDWGYGWRRRETNAGIGQTGDLVTSDLELAAPPVTQTTPPHGCRTPMGLYNCSASEACVWDADHWPACLPRAASRAACVSMFPDQPQVDWAARGRDGTGTDGIGVCVSNPYWNGIIFTNVGAQLLNTAGYEGLRAYFRASQGRKAFWEFTQTSSNFHEIMAEAIGDYEISDAWHTTSTESFPWLDDTTNEYLRAEVLRPARDVPLNFANGGPTSQSLAFQTAGDVDMFLLPIGEGETYRVSVTTTASNVDLCLASIDVLTGYVLAYSAGCSNGATTAADRNATLDVGDVSQGFPVIRVHNMIQSPGPYKLTIENIDDDYPDSIAATFGAAPVGSAGTSMHANARIETASDVDVFRYDLPPTFAGATLTINAQGVSFTPSIELHYAAPGGLPSTSAFAAGFGTVSVTAPSNGSIYIVVRSPDYVSTGGYSVSVDHAGCTTCRVTSNYGSPRALPSSRGGSVLGRLPTGALATGFATQASCDNGVTCDWYGVTLSAGSRLTVTTARAYSSGCNLELAVYGPPDMGWFNTTDGRRPIVFDSGGSMESSGAQLAFVAPTAGQYRIAVRSVSTTGCERYQLTAAHGWSDYPMPPAVH